MTTFTWTDTAPRLSVDGELCYESFFLDGELFKVGDTILVDTGSGKSTAATPKQREGDPEVLDTEHVGKIYRIWEDHTVAWIDVLWYFQPHELPKEFRSRAKHPRELFLSPEHGSFEVDMLTGRAHVLTRAEFSRHSQIAAEFDERRAAESSSSPHPKKKKTKKKQKKKISDPEKKNQITPGVPEYPSTLLFFCERTFDPKKKIIGHLASITTSSSAVRNGRNPLTQALDPEMGLAGEDGMVVDADDSDTNFSMDEAEDGFMTSSSDGSDGEEDWNSLMGFSDSEGSLGVSKSSRGRRNRGRGRSRKTVRRLRLARAASQCHPFSFQWSLLCPSVSFDILIWH